MRFLFILITALTLVPELTQARHIKVYTFNGPSRHAPKQNCLDSLPLGCVSFKTAQTWTVGSQVWSDAVVATGCKKNYYDGGDAGDFKADCRRNEGYGDWFSWEMANRYHEKICPNGWRLPVIADFVALDIALGGSGADSEDEVLRDKYIDDWGGAYNGQCEYGGDYESIIYRGVAAYYWTLSSHEQQPNSAHYMLLYSTNGIEHDYVRLQGTTYKNRGMAVRCVK